MESSEYYHGVIMTKKEYLDLPPMEEYLKIYKDFSDGATTREQAQKKISDVYRALNKKLTEETLALEKEWIPLFPIKRLYGKNFSLSPEFVKLI